MEPNTPLLKRVILSCAIALLSIVTFAQTTDPTNTPGAIFKSGFAAYTQGDYGLAISQFTKAISIDPSKNYYYYNRGMAHKATGNTALALIDFRTSNSIRPTAEAYYQAGIIFFEKNDYVNAQAELENAKILRDDLERMNFCLGMIYFKLERLEDALHCFSAYTAQPKNYADAYYYKGLTEAKLNMYTEAVASFQQALRYKDTDWKLYYKMYEFYIALGDKQNALNSITMVIEIGEKKVEYYEKRAELYKELGFDFKYEEDMVDIKKLKEGGATASASTK